MTRAEFKFENANQALAYLMSRGADAEHYAVQGAESLVKGAIEDCERAVAFLREAANADDAPEGLIVTDVDALRSLNRWALLPAPASTLPTTPLRSGVLAKRRRHARLVYMALYGAL